MHTGKITSQAEQQIFKKNVKGKQLISFKSDIFRANE
jgi:hypothetical protein